MPIHIPHNVSKCEKLPYFKRPKNISPMSMYRLHGDTLNYLLLINSSFFDIFWNFRVF